ncbi:MAG: hypothetical protein AB1414_08265, partial [bacterium]
MSKIILKFFNKLDRKIVKDYKKKEVKEWLDKELSYIRNEADTFRGKFNFAFLVEEAEKKFGHAFN